MNREEQQSKETLTPGNKINYIGGYHLGKQERYELQKCVENGERLLETVWGTGVREEIKLVLKTFGSNYDYLRMGIDGNSPTNLSTDSSFEVRNEDKSGKWQGLPVKPFEIEKPIKIIEGDPSPHDTFFLFNPQNSNMELNGKISELLADKIKIVGYESNLRNVIIKLTESLSTVGPGAFIIAKTLMDKLMPLDEPISRRKFLRRMGIGSVLVGAPLSRFGLPTISSFISDGETRNILQSMQDFFDTFNFSGTGAIVDGRTAILADHLLDASLGDKINPNILLMGYGHSQKGGRMTFDTGLRNENIDEFFKTILFATEQLFQSDSIIAGHKTDISKTIPLFFATYTQSMALPRPIEPNNPNFIDSTIVNDGNIYINANVYKRGQDIFNKIS